LEEKPISEQIVEMLCEGDRVVDIYKKLGIAPHVVNEALKPLLQGARLPYDKRTYKARKEDILSNVEKYKAYTKHLAELRKEYLQSLIKFDF